LKIETENQILPERTQAHYEGLGVVSPRPSLVVPFDAVGLLVATIVSDRDGNSLTLLGL